jgi:ABC-type glutathione transport system ATPase component
MNVFAWKICASATARSAEWREVVHNVSFSLQRGEMLAFVGESGSGKTTTAQAIIGLLANNARRDSGRVEINGEDISDWSANALIACAARASAWSRRIRATP